MEQLAEKLDASDLPAYCDLLQTIIIDREDAIGDDDGDSGDEPEFVTPKTLIGQWALTFILELIKI